MIPYFKVLFNQQKYINSGIRLFYVYVLSPQTGRTLLLAPNLTSYTQEICIDEMNLLWFFWTKCPFLKIIWTQRWHEACLSMNIYKHTTCYSSYQGQLFDYFYWLICVHVCELFIQSSTCLHHRSMTIMPKLQLFSSGMRQDDTWKLHV